jgi:hypothetical protein
VKGGGRSRFQGEPPWLHCEPLQLLAFHLDVDLYSGQVFHFDADPDQLSKTMRIRIRNTALCCSSNKACIKRGGKYKRKTHKHSHPTISSD